MIKAECRVPIIILLLRITYMTKGISLEKYSGIDNIQASDERYIYKDDSYDDNILDYGNENYRKRISVRQINENKFGQGLEINKERKNSVDDKIEKKIISNQNYEQIPQGEFFQTDSHAVKTKDDIGQFQPEKKSHLPPNPEKGNKKYTEMYIFDCDNFNEDVIQRFTGPKVKKIFPMCDIKEYPQFHKNDQLSTVQFVPEKKELISGSNVPKINFNLDKEGYRKIRSQWKVKPHSTSNDAHDLKNASTKESSIDYSHLSRINDKNKESEIIKLATINDLHNENMKFDSNKKISGIHEMTSKLIEGKGNENFQINANILGPINEQKSPFKIIANNKEFDKSNILAPHNGYESVASQVPHQTINNQNRIMSSKFKLNNKAEPTRVGLAQNVMQILKQSGNSNQINKEGVQNFQTLPIINSTIMGQQPEQNSDLNQNIYLPKKNKVPVSSPQPTSLNSSGINSIKPPTMNMLSNQNMNIQPLPILKPSDSQSQIYHSIIPNMSLLSPMTDKGNQKPLQFNLKNRTSELITISIDPKTLQNKILHAEFFKKSEVKKTPDMLTIELLPKEILPNVNEPSNNLSKPKSLEPQTAENLLQISTSVKNGSILITEGEKIENTIQGSSMGQQSINETGYKNENLSLEKQTQGQKKENPIHFSEPYDRLKKSLEISSVNLSDVLNSNSSKEGNIMQSLNENNNLDEMKVLIIKTKDKDVCNTGPTCNPSTSCSLNACGPDSPCQKSTMNLSNFRELNEGLRELRQLNNPYSIVRENPNYTVEEKKTICGKPTCSTPICKKIKREAQKTKVSKLLDKFKPVFIISPKEDNEGNEDETEANSRIEKANFKGSDVSFEKGNKKVENKILEGFINSIIANYSKEDLKPQSRETTERNEGAESLFKLLENSIPKREELEDKKSDIWTNFLTPILIPESSLSKYSDNSEYTKLGPFDENVIKSFLKKDSIPFLQEEKLV